MRNNVRLDGILLSIAVLLGIFASSSQRGQQFYFTNSQQPRFIPSGGFQQQGQQDYFQPQFQEYRLDGYSQGNPPSVHFSAPPQSFTTFQQGGIRRPSGNSFEDHFSQHFTDRFASPQPPRPQSFLDQITLSPSGFTASLPPPQPSRNPNSLRLVQGFPAPSSGQGLIDQFEPRRHIVRTHSSSVLQEGLSSSPLGVAEQNRPSVARDFPTEVDDVGSFVDQNLEIEEGQPLISQRSKINRTSVNSARKEDAALRNKPGTRPQPGLRGNVLTAPQRARQREEESTRIKPKTRSKPARMRHSNTTTSRPRSRFPSKTVRPNKVHFAPRRSSTTPSTSTTSEPEYEDEPLNSTDIVDLSEQEQPSDEALLKTELPSTESGNSSTFEVLTMNPGHTLVEEDNFRGFVDSVLIDATESPTSSTVKASTEESTDPLYVSLHPNDAPEDGMVSVVTTKSVIDGTMFVVPEPSEAPSIAEQAITPSATPPPVVTTTTTEGWVIVASVQTSRSVSGARFLPSSAVKQEERPTALSGKTSLHDKNATDSKRAEQLSKDESASSVENTTSSTSSAITRSTAAPLLFSTESIIDKLDRVQSELSSGILTGGGNKIQLEVLKDMTDSTKMPLNISRTTTYKSPVNIRKFTPHSSRTTTVKPKKIVSFDDLPTDDLTGLLPPGFKHRTPVRRPKSTTEGPTFNVQGDAPVLGGRRNSHNGRVQNQKSPAYKPENSTYQENEKTKQTNSNDSGKSYKHLEELLSRVKLDDVSAFLPPGYKPSASTERPSEGNNSKSIEALPTKVKVDDVSAFAPPGYKPPASTDKPSGGNHSKSIEDLLSKVKVNDVSAFLPPGYKPPASTERPSGGNHSKSIEALLSKVKVDDVSAFLPPGYKPAASTEKSSGENHSKSIEALLSKVNVEDDSAFPPQGYKSQSTTEKPSAGKTAESLLKHAKPVDISAFLPPGYKSSGITEKPANQSKNVETQLKNAFLPPAFNMPNTTSDETSTTQESGLKVVFPSRPGIGRKPVTRTTTTHKPVEGPGVQTPKIVKGWPTRATTAFTGWPTPSTTPISIEKLLEMAKTATTETSSSSTTTTATTTITTTTTTTTPRPTTPGVCTSDCDLAATIKLVGGAVWVPELLDHNTLEWQELANEVKIQLEAVYSKSDPLNKWYKKIRIDSFSEGSILVDYFVELTELGNQVDTQEIKRLFHNSLALASPNDSISNSYARSANLDPSDVPVSSRFKLGNFIVDPKYTDFIVLPKETVPTVTYTESDVLLPQWAIAGVVIGLASLLFVIIFGVTVLVNRSRNNKKKNPAPLTEDMLNELNKNHMGGFENMGADDLYNMEDVWNDKAYEKPPKKRSSVSQENTMCNVYDSWRSDWNGYYYNAYYGNGHAGSSASGYSRRRSDHDTNF